MRARSSAPIRDAQSRGFGPPGGVLAFMIVGLLEIDHGIRRERRSRRIPWSISRRPTIMKASTPPGGPNPRDCASRIGAELRARIEDLTRLWRAYGEGREEEGETLSDYGLSFDYLPAGPFREQTVAYFRWQLSWGGPSDEFRFFVNPD